ncbi:MAG: polysaccharide biosynthesis protein [Mucilaginibacter sp.]|nr:polysaccharide biosynthesis protein [Mucilaginibacter sp.]
MKAPIQRIYTVSSYDKIFEWCKLIAVTGSAQVIIQSIGLLSGILVIHLLPTREYALYTLANTMLGTMIVLADGGISNSVLAQGGKVWYHREKLGSVLATGFNLRKKFAIASLLIAVPFLLYLLRHHNAGWLTSIFIIGALIPAFFTALSGNLLSVGPSLHQTIAPLQKVQVGVSMGRLMMLLLTLFVFPWAYIAIISASIPQILGNIRLRKISSAYADWDQKPDPAIQKEILAIVKRILPGSIYYCLSGQITIWLISIFGTTTTVAQIGALGRLSMMLGLFSAIFGTLILPRFARLINNKELLFKRFIQIQLGLIVLFAFIVLLVSQFPAQLLWILGKNYSGLEKELILNVAGSCTSLFAGLLFTISTSRNWIINPLISIPLTLATIICGVLLINISSLAGILKFNLFVSSTEVIFYFVYCILKINKVQ